MNLKKKSSFFLKKKGVCSSQRTKAEVSEFEECFVCELDARGIKKNDY